MAISGTLSTIARRLCWASRFLKKGSTLRKWVRYVYPRQNNTRRVKAQSWHYRAFQNKKSGLRDGIADKSTVYAHPRMWFLSLDSHGFEFQEIQPFAGFSSHCAHGCGSHTEMCTHTHTNKLKNKINFLKSKGEENYCIREIWATSEVITEELVWYCIISFFAVNFRF